MRKILSRFLRTAALAALAVVWCGSASAYLAPDYTDPNASTYVIGPGSTPDYLTSPNWAYTPVIRKFVDTLPGLTGAGANNLGQFIPIATPDITTYPGSDYYVIELREYEKKMHSDLPPTRLRGYIQMNSGTDTSGCQDPSLPEGALPACTAANNTVAPESTMQYLGPLIISQKDRPVRVKFINNLPTGQGGDLFIPVDTTIMGSGEFDIDYDPVTKEPISPSKTGMFTQNRATLHLHGGKSPWISDGTPHQWITPAGETTDYPRGVSVVNVPDMPDPGPGAQTFYWTNQQSSRMMFYHDHAWGITRLNVYVGEAAGYLIQDPVEKQLVTDGILPAAMIPLVIEDKSYVDAATIMDTDPTWQWGTGPIDPQTGYRQPKTGDLWWPHVYSPAQNPYDITGIAPYGRWAYGPFFWPPTPNTFQPVGNPYFSPLCDPDDPTTPGSFGGYCQPPEIPGTPNPSWGAEAFMDTQTVNGTVYPTVTLEPKPYRLRILNASHDRFVSLSLFYADTARDPNVENAVKCGDFAGGCATLTEVKMVPAVATLGYPATWPIDGREGGVPDPATMGPSWIMIGTEGGFLPKPVVIPPNPVDWNVDVTTFNAGNVNTGSLILGPAERADVIVDFSLVQPGSTLILYNDAPAPWPALDPHYDYYTDAPDNRGMGGTDTTLAGFGPNTRTVMQIKIEGTTGTPFDLTALQAAFTHTTGNPSVFERAQDPIIVAQGNMNPTGDPALYEAFRFDEPFNAYELAYGKTNFPKTWPNWGISRIFDKAVNFHGPDGSTTFTYNATLPNKGGVAMKAKAIQDEQGETFDEYGRMRAALGLEFPRLGAVNFIVQTYNDPVTEVVDPGQVQIWKITHNGVDTHPIHFHLFDVQVLNRVGWDGFVRLPDPTELGWKDTVRISPLEDTIVAVRPAVPTLPFGLPRSYRPMNPARPIGDTMELSPVDPVTGQAWATPNVNIMRDYNWEYVWHCHILSHEENDMMRTVVLNYNETLPAAPTGLTVEQTAAGTVRLDWTDNSANEIRFNVEHWNTGTNTYDVIGETLANAETFTATGIAEGQFHAFRVSAYNAAGIASSNDATINVPTLVPATGVTLQGSPLSPVTVPGSVVFTATGSGGTAPLEYSFWLSGPRTGNVWQNVQPYSLANTWTFNTVGTDRGTNAVKVWVRSKFRTSEFDRATQVSYMIIVPPATNATLAPDVASPTTPGNLVVWTAGASAGTGTYQYRFFLRGPSTANAWVVQQDWSLTNTWTWIPTAPMIGANSIAVNVRSFGSAATSETTATATYSVVAGSAATGVTLTPSIASPRYDSSTITFTAQGSGSNVNDYQYRFYLKGPSTANVWVLKQPYSSSNTWNWVTTAADIGNSTIQVQVKTRGYTITYQALASAAYTIVALTPATGATLSPNTPSPALSGSSIVFSAQGTGAPLDDYEYRFQIRGPATADAWVTMQNWSSSKTWTWNTTVADVGLTGIAVNVRTRGYTTTQASASVTSYRINP